MPLNAYEVTAAQLRAFGAGRATAGDLEFLARSQRSKCLATLALVVRLAAESRNPEAAVAADAWRLLATVQRLAPDALESILRYPTVGAWAVKAVAFGRPRSPADAPPGWIALVAAAAAIRGAVPFDLELPPTVGAGTTLHLPSLGTLSLPGPFRGEAVALRGRGETIEVTGPRGTLAVRPLLEVEQPNWRSLPVLSAGSGRMRFQAVLDDADPYRPARRGDAPLDHVTPAQLDCWQRRLRGGWQLLVGHHEQAAADILALVRAVTPLNVTGEATQSLTSRQLFGSIAMSLPESELSAALTLSHEIQHVKLCALMDLLPLVADPAPGLYYAPWRSDPRPLASLLQGMYAHLGVASFWRRHVEVAQDRAEVHHAFVEFAKWRSACARVAKVLSARLELTAAGMAFVDGMNQVLRGWRSEYVPAAAQAQADRAISEHRDRWA
jgi:HEXXH motif-containing protein